MQSHPTAALLNLWSIAYFCDDLPALHSERLWYNGAHESMSSRCQEQRTMSLFTDYTPDEQQLLLRSLQAAAVAISAASLGRKTETVSEGFAAASLIMERSEVTVGNPLITSVQFALDQRAKSGQPFPSYEKAASAPDAREEAMQTLRQVAALVDAKAPADEAQGYKRWLLEIAQHTAEAGKEGGNFFGRGAVLVNEAEKDALAEMAQVLGM
jgi:hypothetical protein